MQSRPPKNEKGENAAGWGEFDRPPVPDVVRESNTESAWAEFNSLSEPGEFPPTENASLPMPLPKGDRRYSATVPAGLGRPTQPAPIEPAVQGVTLEQAIAEARRNNRVCPKAKEWQKLYMILPAKRKTERGWEPQLPPTGSAWSDSTALDKFMCLRDHLVWAEQKGALDAVYAFLRALPEDSWFHT
jgi:hypothetical protein